MKQTPPLPAHDGSAEGNIEPLPGGGYTCEWVPAWSEALVLAYAKAYHEHHAAKERALLEQALILCAYIDDRPTNSGGANAEALRLSRAITEHLKAHEDGAAGVAWEYSPYDNLSPPKE